MSSGDVILILTIRKFSLTRSALLLCRANLVKIDGRDVEDLFEAAIKVRDRPPGLLPSDHVAPAPGRAGAGLR